MVDTLAFPNLQAELSRVDMCNKDLAEMIGVDPSVVSRWFNGKQKMPVSACFLIKERVFPRLSIDYLFSPEPIVPET